MWLNSLLSSRFHQLPDRPVLEGREGQSSIPNLYFTGSLAGHPNIETAIDAAINLARVISTEKTQIPQKCDVHVGIIGGGPAGIALALALEDLNISFQVLEKQTVFQTLKQFPSQKMIYRTNSSQNLQNPLTFTNTRTDDLLNEWDQQIASIRKNIQEKTEIVDIRHWGNGFNIHCQQASQNQQIKVAVVVIATGTQNEAKRLNIPGEDSTKVFHHCHTPIDFIGQKVAIIGGGRTAVETHLLLKRMDVDCIHIHRGKDFAKAGSDLSSQLTNTTSTLILNHTATALIENEVGIEVQISSNTKIAQQTRLQVDNVLVLIGGTPNSELLKTIEYPTEQSKSPNWWWGLISTFLVYVFYILKSGTTEICADINCIEPIWLAQKSLWPFTLEYFRQWPSILRMGLGFREVDGAFWCSLLYSMVVAIFGFKAIRHYNTPTQRNRYLSLITFQCFCLFGIPEVIAPALIDAGVFLGGLERPWKLYSALIPWPLSLYSIVDYPQQVNASIALGWMGLGLCTTLILIPLYVKYQGQRFCSYLCGCGGLAETLGDAFRSLAPKGVLAKKIEGLSRVIFLLAIIVTLLILNDAWKFVASDALYNTKSFAEHWYGLMIDFWLAGVVGVALYPLLGNRVWCRFACPLRAYMEILAQHTSRISIDSNEQCIGCYECTRHCQMGIPVDQFALRHTPLTPQNTSCIQCGICIDVCPLDVLSIGQSGEPVQIQWKTIQHPPNPPWLENKV